MANSLVKLFDGKSTAHERALLWEIQPQITFEGAHVHDFF